MYLSSCNGENTRDSDIILTKNNDINTEIPKDDNHEEVKSKSRASSENIPSDPKNGNVKGFPQRKDDKAELKLGRRDYILKKGCKMHTDMTSEDYNEVYGS